MALTAEGLIEIPLEEFYKWVNVNYAVYGMEAVYGPPSYNESTQSLDVLFAISDTNNPESWATKPKALLAWDKNKIDVPN